MFIISVNQEHLVKEDNMRQQMQVQCMYEIMCSKPQKYMIILYSFNHYS